MVGVIPFQLAHSGVLDGRFTQLVIAAKIHQRGVKDLPESEDENAFGMAFSPASVNFNEYAFPMQGAV